MHVVVTIIWVIFVGLIIAIAVTIGVSLLLWCMLAGIVFSVVVMLRQHWLRWKFLRDNDAGRPAARPDVIEGVYTEIKDDKP